jgi:hypothetical protein
MAAGDGVIPTSDISRVSAMQKRAASGSKISAGNKRKIQILEMLDEETLGRLLQEYGGGDVQFDPHMAELQTMGGEIARAANDFQNRLDKGDTFAEALDKFYQAKDAGLYDISTDQVKTIESKLMDSSILHQKAGSNTSAAKMKLFKDLGVPELALIDSGPKQTAASKAPNPFDMPSAEGAKYQTQLEALVKQQAELQKNKPKNKGLKGFADSALTVTGGILGGLGGGFLGTFLPTGATTVAGAGIGGFAGAALGSNIIGDPSDKDWKKKLADLSSQQINAEQLVKAADSRQKAKADLYEQVYTKALASKGQGGSSKYDAGRQKLISQLAGR